VLREPAGFMFLADERRLRDLRAEAKRAIIDRRGRMAGL
jgi:hypothetical protein